MQTFLTGFSVRRVAWYVAALGLAMPFSQLCTPGGASGIVTEGGMLLGAMAYPLCLLLPRDTPKRFVPAGAGGIGFFLNIVGVH